jgi:diguanylate cyclase (GGDEF)-like protein
MIIFAAFLARIFASRLTRPLRQLTAATALFRNGRIARLPTSSMIELDALARALETTFQERRILEDRLKEIAAKDQLLQITNRAHFDAEATELLTGLQSDKQACLLFIDLDHFKQINDKYGHEAGDRVLQIAVDRIKSRIRHTDLIGRRGGDELTLLLNNVDREIATKIGHDLVRIISEPIMLDGIGRVNVGASIGLAHFPDDASTLKDLMTAADTAMYQAKANGRGRVTNFEKAHAP